MKLVIQRVVKADVHIAGRCHAAIASGMMILVGVADNDSYDDVERMAAKTAALRIFDDENGVMNLCIRDTGGEILAISQFTLLAMACKGNRPSYIHAMRPPEASELYDLFCKRLSDLSGCRVAKGVFGADMQVGLINDGPVTIIIDSHE